MAKAHTFILEHTLKGDFEIIYSCLLDFRKFGEVHPYMTGVTVITEQPDYIEYDIREEVYLFGFIKNHPRYSARVMELKKHEHLRYTSPVKKNIFLTVDLTFATRSNGTIVVTEAFKIESNPILARVFGNILKKAHLKFFDNLNTLSRISVEDVKLR